MLPARPTPEGPPGDGGPSRAARALAALAVAVVALAAAPAVAGAGFGAPRTLSDWADGPRFADAAPGRVGSVGSILAWSEPARLRAVRVGADGRLGEPHTLAGGQPTDVAVAVDRAGDAVAVWLDGRPGRLRTLADGVADDAAGVGSEPRSPAVAAGGDLGGLAAWTAGDGPQRLVQYALRGAGGRFGAARTLPEPAGVRGDRPVVAAGGAGAAVIAWEAVGAGSRALRVATRDGGDVGPALTLSAQGRYPDAVVLPDGTTLVAWEDGGLAAPRIAVAARAPGEAFGPPQLVSAPGEDAGLPALAVAPDGTALLAWLRTPAGGSPEIVTSERPPGGAFAPGSAPAGASPAGDHSTAVAPDGTRVLAWLSGAGGEVGLHAATRAPGEPYAAPATLEPTGVGGMDAAGPVVAWQEGRMRADGIPESRMRASVLTVGASTGAPGSPGAADRTRPRLRLRALERRPRRGRIRVRVRSSEAAALRVSGRLRGRATRTVRRRLPARRAVTIAVRVPRGARLPAVLRLTARATDAAGNRGAATLRVKLKR